MRPRVGNKLTIPGVDVSLRQPDFVNAFFTFPDPQWFGPMFSRQPHDFEHCRTTSITVETAASDHGYLRLLLDRLATCGLWMGRSTNTFGSSTTNAVLHRRPSSALHVL